MLHAAIRFGAISADSIMSMVKQLPSYATEHVSVCVHSMSG